MTRDYETKARSIQCPLQDYGSGLPAWLDKQERSPLPGQRMIWFGDVKRKKVGGWKRALYSATGRHVIVQCEIESYGIPSIPVTRYQEIKTRSVQCLLQDVTALVSPLSRARTERSLLMSQRTIGFRDVSQSKWVCDRRA